MSRYELKIDREYYHYALVCSVLCNINRDPKKGKTYKPEDFMPRKERAKENKPVTAEILLNRVKQWQALFEARERVNGRRN